MDDANYPLADGAPVADVAWNRVMISGDKVGAALRCQDKKRTYVASVVATDRGRAEHPELVGKNDLDAVTLFAPDTEYSRLLLDLIRQYESVGRLTVADTTLYPPRTSYPAMAPVVAQLS